MSSRTKRPCRVVIGVVWLTLLQSISAIAQTHLDVKEINRSDYPTIHASFYVKDSNDRIYTPTQMSEATLSLRDSMTGDDIPILYLFTPEVDSLNEIHHTASVLFSVDVSNGVTAGYGLSFEFAKAFIKRIVRALDLQQDYVAIQLVSDTTILGLDWTNDLGRIISYVDRLDQEYRVGRRYDLVGAFTHPVNGMTALLDRSPGADLRSCLVLSAGAEEYCKWPIMNNGKDTNQEAWAGAGYVTGITNANWLVYMRPDRISVRKRDNGHPHSDSCEYTKWGVLESSQFDRIIDFQTSDTVSKNREVLNHFQQVAYDYEDKHIVPRVSFVVPTPDQPVTWVRVRESVYDLIGTITVINPTLSVRREEAVQISIGPNPASEFLYFHTPARLQFRIVDGSGNILETGYTSDVLNLRSYAMGSYHAVIEGLQKPIKFLVVR